jgi:predicted protein tyrosine phosphatase
MPSIYVCPVTQVATTVAASAASHLVTILYDTELERPATIAPERHLRLRFQDIADQAGGPDPPTAEHIESIITFARGWDRERPMVIHCFAGISRSTAAAYISLCALRPEEDERAIAARLRASSEMATPNRLMVGLADRILGRKGRMIESIVGIGRGVDAFEGRPFSLPLVVPVLAP